MNDDVLWMELGTEHKNIESNKRVHDDNSI